MHIGNTIVQSDEACMHAWYWPKCILHSGLLCITSMQVIWRDMWFIDCLYMYRESHANSCKLNKFASSVLKQSWLTDDHFSFTAVAIRIKVQVHMYYLSHYEQIHELIVFYFLQVQSCSAMQWLKCAKVVVQCSAHCAHHKPVSPTLESPITNAKDAPLL